MKNKTFNVVLSVAVIAVGVLVSHYFVANAQTTTTVTPIAVVATTTASSTVVSPSSLQYPIAALGNCGSVSACRTYCNNPSNEGACLAFAEQNRLMTQEQVQRAQAFLALVQNGGTPGNCSSASACRTYCSDASHGSECLAFAEKEGFVSQAQVQAIQQNAGKGPGGCDSEQACTAFCNNAQNQTACLDFAKRNGLISEVQAQNIQQSATGLKIGLAQFPGQVVNCLKSELGDSAVGELESGNLTPNASTSATVTSCFNAYKSQIQSRFRSLVQSTSTAVQTCLQSVGSSTIADLANGNLQAIQSDQGEKIRECLGQTGDQNQERNQSSTQEQERNQESVQNRLDGMNLPDRVKSCVEPYLLANPSSTNIGQIISNCMQAFGTSTQAGEGEGRGPAGTPQQIRTNEGEGQGPAGMPVRSGSDNAPMIPATSSNSILPQQLQNVINGGGLKPLPAVQDRGGDQNQGGDN